MATPETYLKQQCKDYLRIKGIFFYHNLQGVGAFRGLPDLGMHYEGKVHYLEIKKPGGKLSEHQERFKQQCELDDIPYHVIRQLEDLQAIVDTALAVTVKERYEQSSKPHNTGHSPTVA